MISLTTQSHTAADTATYLAHYLRLLPDDAHRAAILRLLRQLEPAAAGELADYLRQLDVSVAADPRFRETYLFAPRQWSSRTLEQLALRWAHPALRHLVSVPESVTREAATTDAAAATLFFREPGGISDMWVLAIPEGTEVTLATMGSTLAIAPVGDVELAMDGHPVAGSSVAVSQQRTVSVTPASSRGQGCLAMVVASRALLDTASAAQWLTSHSAGARAEPVNATAEIPRSKYQHGPRSNSIGLRHAPAPS